MRYWWIIFAVGSVVSALLLILVVLDERVWPSERLVFGGCAVFNIAFVALNFVDTLKQRKRQSEIDARKTRIEAVTAKITELQNSARSLTEQDHQYYEIHVKISRLYGEIVSIHIEIEKLHLN